jgi:hypothetical protein
MWILCGNATESEDLGGSPKKSYLFFLTVNDTLKSVCLELGFNGRKSAALLRRLVRSRRALKIRLKE